MGSNPASPTIISKTIRRLATCVLFPVVAVCIPTGINVRDLATTAPTARQEVIVEVSAVTSTSGTLRLVEVVDGRETVILGPVVARVGRSGVSASHREGDGTTPLGRFRIIGAFGRSASPRVQMPYHRVREGDCWISASQDSHYNTWVRRNSCVSPNEDLWKIAKAGPYEYALTTSYNTSPVMAGKGSAIFIHVSADDGVGGTRPTSGCVSVAKNVMKRLFALLDPAKNPVLIVRIKRS